MNDHFASDVWLVYQDIRKRVERIYDMRMTVSAHVIAYMIGMTAMRSTLMLEDGRYMNLSISLLMLATIWTVGILIHLSIYMLTELRERTLISEVAPLLAYARVHDTTMESHFDNVQLFDEQGRLSNE